MPLDGHLHRELLLSVVEDAVTRLVLPSLEREVRRRSKPAEAVRDVGCDVGVGRPQRGVAAEQALCPALLRRALHERVEDRPIGRAHVDALAIHI